MFKKLTVGICLALCCFFLVPTFDSNAATSYVLDSKFPQPYADESQSGYLNLAIENYWSARDLCTIAWQIVPVTSNGASTVKVTVNQNSISFSAEIIDSSYYVNLWELQPSGYASLLTSALVTNQYTRSTSWNGGTIVGASVFGHCSKFSYYGGSYVPSVTAIWSEQGTQISKYNEILNSLNGLNSTLGGKLDSLISEVHSVFLQVDTAEDTLSRIRELMVQYYPQFQDELETIVKKIDSMIAEQKKTNSWLEKIYELLEEQPEKEKNEAQTSGSNSISQGTDSIEDKGTGFADGLSGLVSSMSYSGTQASWTFPEVRLPAINGVMDEKVLIEEQPIDFTVWINAIPSPILLLIQSVLTMALIVYCFKELYGTISYVLTLRGGGSNE